jgi:hypothetical protein
MVQSSAASGNLVHAFSNAALRFVRMQESVAIAEWNGQAKRNYEQLALKAHVQRAELGAIKAALVITLLGAIPGAAATTYGEALSSGIQDISAVATLFGTEACAAHLLSSISKGYIYASVSMLSMFGSLAAVKASAYLILPAEWLKNAGMTDCGADLETMGWGDSAWPTNILADRLGSVPGGTSKIDFTPELRKWIIQATLTGLSGALGIVPFLAPLILAWDHVYAAFPIMRVVGGTLIGCLVPITTILSLETDLKKSYKIYLRTLLGIGATMTLIGYVGCYAYIQSFPEQWMVYQWLALEVALMLIRFWCWAWNPKFDDMPDLVTTTYTPSIAIMAPFTLPCYFDNEQGGIGWPKYVINVATHIQVVRGLRHAGLAVNQLPEASFFLIDDRERGPILWVIDTVGISSDGQITKHPAFMWRNGKADIQWWMEVAIGGSVAWRADRAPEGADSAREVAKRRLESRWKELNEVVSAVGRWAVSTRSVKLSTMLPTDIVTKDIVSWKLDRAGYADQCGCQHCLKSTLAERLTCLWYAAQLEQAQPVRIKCITDGHLPWKKSDLAIEKALSYYLKQRGRVGVALPLFNEERIFRQFQDRTDISAEEMARAVATEVEDMSRQLGLPGSPLWLSHSGKPINII